MPVELSTAWGDKPLSDEEAEAEYASTIVQIETAQQQIVQAQQAAQQANELIVHLQGRKATLTGYLWRARQGDTDADV